MSKWTFNNQEGGTWSSDIFATKEEAIAAGIEAAKWNGWLELFIGEATETPIDYQIDADDVIGKAADYIDDNYGGDFDPGSEFLLSISDEDTECLQKHLDDAFSKWIEERKIKSNSFIIENTERIELEDQK